MSLRDMKALASLLGCSDIFTNDTREDEPLRRLQLAVINEVRLERRRRTSTTQTSQIDPADVEREMAKSRQVLRQEARLAKKGRKA